MSEPLYCLECAGPVEQCDCPASIRLTSHVPLDVYRAVRDARREIEILIAENTTTADLWCLACGHHADRCSCAPDEQQHVARTDYDAAVLRVGGQRLQVQHDTGGTSDERIE